MRIASCIVVSFILMIVELSALDFYVSPDIRDANEGSKEKPFRSLAHARDVVRKSKDHGGKPVTVYLINGVHYLADTLVLTPEDSGTEQAPVIYAAEEKGKAIVSGGMRLSLQWKPYRDGIMQYIASQL